MTECLEAALVTLAMRRNGDIYKGIQAGICGDLVDEQLPSLARALGEIMASYESGVVTHQPLLMEQARQALDNFMRAVGAMGKDEDD